MTKGHGTTETRAEAKLETLDPTTPWYEFLSYCEACRSLNVKASVGRFTRYQNYIRTISL